MVNGTWSIKKGSRYRLSHMSVLTLQISGEKCTVELI